MPFDLDAVDTGLGRALVKKLDETLQGRTGTVCLDAYRPVRQVDRRAGDAEPFRCLPGRVTKVDTLHLAPYDGVEMR